MKNLKNLSLMAILMTASVASFAVSSQAGLDLGGNGVVSVSGIAVGSCFAPTIPLELGEVDFYTQANAPTGSYQQNIDIPITCTNPNQNWSILPQTVPITVNGGSVRQMSAAGGEEAYYDDKPSKNYVSLTSVNLVPGAKFSDNRTAAVINGLGNQTVTAKIVIGHNVAVDPALIPAFWASADYYWGTIGSDGGTGPTFDGAVPTGTIQNRGEVFVDIPLQILY
jgi:hypothetical protein